MRARAAVAVTMLLALGPFPATSAAPAQPTVPEVVAGLQGWLDGTRTLDVRFRQALISGALGATAIESGRMYLERPGKLRFDYLVPERKIALLVGDRTELYLEDDRQLTRGRLDGEQSLFPRLLAGRDRVDTLFDATLVGVPSAGHGSYRLKLAPRDRGGALTEVTLVLRPRTFEIEAAEVLDEMGNRTTYAFSGSKRNGRLPDGIFAFEPPPGTEVIDER
jgi:outer membrane lipoprotein carrier protein